MADYYPTTPLSLDVDQSLAKMTVSDLLQFITFILEDKDSQTGSIAKGEIVAENLLVVNGSLELSARAIQSIKDALGL